jgi:hypothetical protein
MTQSEVVQIDKRFIVVIVTILLQSAAVVWGASAMWSSIETLRETDARLEAADVQIRIDAAAREARLRSVENGAARVDERLIAIQDGINEIKRQLEARP